MGNQQHLNYQHINHHMLHVGIMESLELEFSFNGTFLTKIDGLRAISVTGIQTVKLYKDALNWNGFIVDALNFIPHDFTQGSFTLHNVTIGKSFHWEQQENQTFQGCLRLQTNDNRILAINIINVEQYLESVISSEMKSTSSIELLKAHAVISRSWVYSQILRREMMGAGQHNLTQDNEGLSWQDQSDHTLFDVCADDHCQRYQGISKGITPEVHQAVSDTYRQVLTYQDVLCDTRFSKCCGGISER